MKTNAQLNQNAVDLRRKLDLNENEPIELIPLILTKLPEITLIFTPMADTSGVCINNCNVQIIGINSNLRKGRLRFTIAHELYHLLIEKTEGEPIVCDNFYKNDSEKEAESFASYFLITNEGLNNYKKINTIKNWNLDNVIAAEQYFQMSHEAFLVRLEKNGEISSSQRENLSKVIITQESKVRGHPIDLYVSTDYENQSIVLGDYMNKIRLLDSKNALRPGKRRKLLLDGFRWDLVFNKKREEDVFE